MRSAYRSISKTLRAGTAFVFENALDAAGTHLFEGPIIALVLGTIASAITSVIRK
jgi:hypothetical protein